MRVLIIFSFLILPSVLKAQKIRLNKFDSIDSVQQIETKEEKIAGGLHFYAAFNDHQKAEYSGMNTGFTYIVFIFKPYVVTSLTDESYAKIQFIDGTVKQYNYFGSYKLLSGSEDEFVEVKVPDGGSDDLYIKPIKHIRISTTNLPYDYDIDIKNSEILKNCLVLLKNTLPKK